MEIELPDGTVLDAPDGADVKQVVQGYRRQQLAAKNPAEYSPQSQQFKDRYGPQAAGQAVSPSGDVRIDESRPFVEGIGSGMVRANRGLSNAAMGILNKHPLIKAIGGLKTPTYASDEAIQTQDELDAPLTETGRGSVGQMVGQAATATAATAPLGGLGAVSKAGSVLPRALAHPTTRAALEGGAAATAAADPNDQGEDSVKGAALSATMERMFGLGGRAISGLIKKNEATEALQQLAQQQGEEIFVPVSQAATQDDLLSRGAKILYGEGLSLVPGVRGQLVRQADDATEKVRELAVKEATPEGVHLPDRPGHNVQESIASIRQGFDEAYDDTIKKLYFRIPDNLRTRLQESIAKSDPNIDRESADKAMRAARGLLRRFSNETKYVGGAGMLTIRTELRKAAEKAPDFERKAYQGALEVIDDMINHSLKVKGLDKKFANLEEPARHLRGLENAAHSARAQSGRFTPNQLALHAKDATQLDLAQTAGSALKGSAAGTSFAGRSLIGGVGTLGGAAAVGGPAAAGIALVGANLLATKTAQKALMGDTVAQKVIMDLLEKHPEAAESVERALRTAAATNVGE